jgi:hypothetical protein
MKFNLTPVGSDSTPRFEVTIQYLHGATDYTVRHDIAVIPSGDLGDLEKYITRFNELSHMVEANRTDGVEYPVEYRGDFEDYFAIFEVEGLDVVSIELVNDETDDDFDCFARMSITEIFYYNEHGAKFKVEISE